MEKRILLEKRGREAKEVSFCFCFLKFDYLLQIPRKTRGFLEKFIRIFN